MSEITYINCIISSFFIFLASGSSLAGKKPGLIDSSLHVLFIVPDYVPEEQKFDLTFMVSLISY